MNEFGWAGLGAAIVAIITAIVAGIVKVIQARSALSQEDVRTKDQIHRGEVKDRREEYERVIDILERRLQQYEKQQLSDIESMRKLWLGELDCREQVAELKTLADVLHSGCTKMAQQLKEAGLPIQAFPELPPTKHKRTTIGEMEFDVRTAEQNLAILKKLDKGLPPL